MNFLSALPSTNFATFSSLSDSLFACSSLASLASFTRPRALPFTCTPISITSSTQSAGSKLEKAERLEVAILDEDALKRLIGG